MNLGNYTPKSLGLKIKSYFFDPLMIFWIYEKKFLASRLGDKNSIFFILFSIELEFFVVITDIKCVNFVVIVNIEIRTFLLMIFSKNHFFVNYSVGELGFVLYIVKKLVKSNVLWFLEYVMVFWRVFSFRLPLPFLSCNLFTRALLHRWYTISDIYLDIYLD